MKICFLTGASWLLAPTSCKVLILGIEHNLRGSRKLKVNSVGGQSRAGIAAQQVRARLGASG